MSDRMSSLQAELSAAALEAERMSREAANYKEQEQVALCLNVSYVVAEFFSVVSNTRMRKTR